jgi:thiopeptide-type bacteriocin biosynthesis protein
VRHPRRATAAILLVTGFVSASCRHSVTCQGRGPPEGLTKVGTNLAVMTPLRPDMERALMADPPLFVPMGVVLLRMPTRPIRHATDTRLDLQPGSDGYSADLSELVRTWMNDAFLREAVEVSSAAVAAALHQLQKGAATDETKLRRLAHTLARYRLRASGRPTPFGLLAGVAVGTFGASTKVRLGSQHRKGVRPDADWLTGLVTGWERHPAVRGRLRIVANDLCIVRGNRLVLPHRPRASSGAERDSVLELSVRLTEPVRTTLEFAATPVPYRDLISRLAAVYRRASARTVETMIGQLIEQDILLTDLRPPLTHPDPLGHVVERLHGTDLPELATLRRIAELLSQYAQQPLGGGRTMWSAATAEMTVLSPRVRSPVQVDLRVDADVTLPSAVAAEAARAASVLWRLSSPESMPPHLRQYHRAFVERYGFDRLVPLLEVVDPERGLGAPAGYREPPSDRRLESDRHAGRRPWESGLASLAERALLDGSNEVVLDDVLVDTLTAGDSSTLPPPATVELTCQVLAESGAALDAGDFQLVVTPGAGSQAAGSMFGRFCYLFEDGSYPVGPSAQADDHRQPIQLLFQPLHPRGANVVRVPRVSDWVLALGIFAERDDPRVLGATDIAVGADASRLRLVSLRDGRELNTFSPHMLAMELSAGNAARLVREIGGSGYRGYHGWSWGDAEVFPRLPRVRYGRTVLAPEVWRPASTLLDKNLPWSRWRQALADWRYRWNVPDRVEATMLDTRLELDLSASLHQQLLREELTRRPETVVREAIGTEADAGWLYGHANELVIPLARGAGREDQRTRRTDWSVRRHPRSISGPHLPGGEWLYAKLYSSFARHDELLAEHLSDLIARLPPDVDRWFYVRYADPEPHLRLRFHGSASALNGELLPRLHHWAKQLCNAGLASRMSLDAYEPELERYGGAGAIEAAERVFAVDSEVALVQIRLRHRGLNIPTELLAAASYIDMLRGFGDLDWRGWQLGQRRGEHHAAFQAIRRRATGLIDLVGDWPELAATEKSGQLLAAWHRRQLVVAKYSKVLRKPAIRMKVAPALLHMHHNRFVGVDSTAEARSLAIARGVIQAHLDRMRAGA